METDIEVPIPPVPPEVSNSLRFKTYFDRANPVVSSDMLPYTRGEHVYCTKQVPSVLALAGTGNPTLGKVAGLALMQGVSMTCKHKSNHAEETGLFEPDVAAKKFIYTTFFAPSTEDPLGETVKQVMEMPMDPQDLHPDINDPSYRFRPRYDDPFKIVAGRILARAMGYKPPTTTVWPGDGKRLSDPMPAMVLNSDYQHGSSKNSIRFELIGNVEQKLHVLLRHTFWGRKITSLMQFETELPKGTPKKEIVKQQKRDLAVRAWAILLARG